MTPYAFGAGITKAEAYQACGSALGNRGYSSAVAGRIDTAISSRAATGAAMSLNASALSHIQTAMTNQGYTAARAGYLDNIIKDIEDAVGTATMDGNEDTIKEFTSLTQRMDCYLDLANMASGDTIVLKQYMKIKSGGSYRLFGTESFVGAQTQPLVYLELKPAKYGFKISLQQTGGTNRNVDWQTYKQVKSG